MSKKQSQATRQANAERAAARAAAIREEQQRKERRRRTLTVGGTVAVVLAVILIIGYAVQASRDTTGQAATAPSGADRYVVPFGEASAPVSVTIYEDFMCPYCGQFEAASRSALEKYVDQGDVQIRYHILSFLDRASNGTEYSTRASNAMAVVLDTSGPDVAKKFHDLLYENQPQEGSDGLSDQQLVDYAVQAGASEGAVQGPIQDLKFEQWVKNSTDAASKDGVNSTPTVTVDGKKLEATTIDGLVGELEQRIQDSLGG